MTLGAGDVVRAEAGTLMYMTDGVDMDAKMEGGLLGGLKRKLLAGESLFITYFKGTSAGAKVAFAGPYPGKIIHIALERPAGALPARRVPLRHRRHRPEHRVHQAPRRRILRRRGVHPAEDGRAGRPVHPQRRHHRAVRAEAGRAPARGHRLPGRVRRRPSITTSRASAASRRACSAAKGCSSRRSRARAASGCRRCRSRGSPSASTTRTAATART